MYVKCTCRQKIHIKKLNSHSHPITHLSHTQILASCFTNDYYFKRQDSQGYRWLGTASLFLLGKPPKLAQKQNTERTAYTQMTLKSSSSKAYAQSKEILSLFFHLKNPVSRKGNTLVSCLSKRKRLHEFPIFEVSPGSWKTKGTQWSSGFQNPSILKGQDSLPRLEKEWKRQVDCRIAVFVTAETSLHPLLLFTKLWTNGP